MDHSQENTYERILDIIIYLVSELKQNKDMSEIDIQKLEKKGYTSSEISTAFSWLVDRMEFNANPIESENDAYSYRILHEAEKDLFTQEAWGDLIQLQSLGIINNSHIEFLIEKALLSTSRKIDSFQLKAYVANGVLDISDDDKPGSRVLLNGNDLIH